MTRRIVLAVLVLAVPTLGADGCCVPPTPVPTVPTDHWEATTGNHAVCEGSNFTLISAQTGDIRGQLGGSPRFHTASGARKEERPSTLSWEAPGARVRACLFVACQVGHTSFNGCPIGPGVPPAASQPGALHLLEGPQGCCSEDSPIEVGYQCDHSTLDGVDAYVVFDRIDDGPACVDYSGTLHF